eukprot:TRINITY_DN28799_c0_g1_i2.p1 TRINITY_DN28799_c0_g1~~TRINITY_DN28799_c0_g1_i2.p1  ORF type:complete len:329 (-),score=34.99 TRINITY_DN28799_c0_g1_i2:1185-2105(-)
MTVTVQDKRPQWLKNMQPFAVGGMAGCMATSCVQPIDMIKVRIQLVEKGGGTKNPLTIASKLIRDEGFLSLYKGLDAGLIRQITYTTARIGVFRYTCDWLKEDGKPLPLQKKAFAGLFAGGIGSIIGNPADLSLIRLQSDATLPVEQRRNYTGFANAFSRTVNEEGVLALWKGCAPTIVRAMALNLGQLASFDQAKEMIAVNYGKGQWQTLLASAISGFFAVTFSLPFDFVKTRIQKMKKDPVTGEYPYKNMLHCMSRVAREEGLGAFYSGYPTYYVRIAPHAMITLLAIDAIDQRIAKSFNPNSS